MTNLIKLGASNFANDQDAKAQLTELNQKKLFNDYVNVGISHRIASGLSGRMSGIITEEYCNAIAETEKKIARRISTGIGFLQQQENGEIKSG